jgi:selenocysteine-specific elongation factor
VNRLMLGVIGHVDHGKTALVHALTGQHTDRLPEEKARGISIALGFAHLDLAGGGVVDLIDMPGHERFVRTMVSGATGINAVLLVVAANEGIKPQTIEHVDIAGLLGLRRAIVAITKADLVTEAEAAAVADQAVGLLERAGLEPLPPVMTSALTCDGIADLSRMLAALAAEQRPRAADGVPFLPIDRTFSIAGHGPVVTGTLRGAAIATGDVLALSPSGNQVRVRSLQVHGERVTSAEPGQRVAINLRGVESAELERGMALAAPDTLASSGWLTIALRAVGSAPPLKNGKRLRALLGTSEVEVRLRLLDRDVLEPGDTGFAQLHCAEPVALPAGEHVILRIASPARTVAGGRVIEPEARRQRRNDAMILTRLEALRDLPPAAMIAAEVERGGLKAITLQCLSRLSGLAVWRVSELLQPLPVFIAKSGLVVPKAPFERLIAHIPALLRPREDGMARDKLLAVLPGTEPAVLDEALAMLMASTAIRKRGSRYVIPRPDDDRIRALDEAELGVRIAELLLQAGLTPPTPREIVTGPAISAAVDRLLRAGVLIRAVDRAKGKELLFHRQAIEQAQQRLAPLLAREPGLLVSEIAAALGISRKYAMPLLDHLDTIRFTRRIGDYRRIWAE